MRSLTVFLLQSRRESKKEELHSRNQNCSSSFDQMPLAGAEPGTVLPRSDFESSASANSATAAHEPLIILDTKPGKYKKKI